MAVFLSFFLLPTLTFPSLSLPHFLCLSLTFPASFFVLPTPHPPLCLSLFLPFSFSLSIPLSPPPRRSLPLFFSVSSVSLSILQGLCERVWQRCPRTKVATQAWGSATPCTTTCTARPTRQALARRRPTTWGVPEPLGSLPREASPNRASPSRDTRNRASPRVEPTHRCLTHRCPTQDPGTHPAHSSPALAPIQTVSAQLFLGWRGGPIPMVSQCLVLFREWGVRNPEIQQ